MYAIRSYYGLLLVVGVVGQASRLAVGAERVEVVVAVGVGGVDDGHPVARKGRVALVGRRVGELRQALAVGADDVEVPPARPVRRSRRSYNFV